MMLVVVDKLKRKSLYIVQCFCFCVRDSARRGKTNSFIVWLERSQLARPERERPYFSIYVMYVIVFVEINAVVSFSRPNNTVRAFFMGSLPCALNY